MPAQAARVHSVTGSRSQRCGSSDSVKFGSASCGSLRAFSTTRQGPSSSSYRDMNCSRHIVGSHRPRQNGTTPRGPCDDDEACYHHQNYDCMLADICPSMPNVCGDFADKMTTPCVNSNNEPGCRRTAHFLYNMWIDQKLCDVVLRCVGTGGRSEEKILAHKIALAAYSDYLVNTFTVFPPTEVVAIDLTSYPQEAVSSVVRFVYTGELELTRDTVGPVWQVAEGLGISTVAGLCEDFLGQTTPENAIYHYAVAEKYQLQELSRRIYAFIQERFVDVSNTVEFQFLPVERLTHLLRDDQLNVSSELDVYAALIRWIDADRQKRLCVAAELLRETVRLQCIKPESLITHVEAVSWLFNAVPECQLAVNDALRFHALALSESSLVQQFPRQTARRYVLPQHR